MLKRLSFFAVSLFIIQAAGFGQGDELAAYRKVNARVNEVFNRREDTLKAEFERRGLSYPARCLYLRSFKMDEQLEVWVRNSPQEPFKFFKTYKVCATPGRLGPKRKEGDKQVPEGFYYINELNPNSHYHLSLGINYPNMSDRMLADSIRPGGDIYIHGDCVSIGCIAINNGQIEEVYMLSAMARSQGQEFIPVHIFPVKFSNPKSAPHIEKIIKDNPAYIPFLKTMQSVFYHFEKSRSILPVMISKNGVYVSEDVAPPVQLQAAQTGMASKTQPLRVNRGKTRKFAPGEIAGYVEKQPLYPEGMEAYNRFLTGLSGELSSYLDENVRRAFVYVEFVVDADGAITNVSVAKGGNDAMADIIVKRFEKMPKWTPAIKDNREVAYKMYQTVFVEVQTAQ